MASAMVSWPADYTAVGVINVCLTELEPIAATTSSDARYIGVPEGLLEESEQAFDRQQ